jgi:hypothetical protein
MAIQRGWKNKTYSSSSKVSDNSPSILTKIGMPQHIFFETSSTKFQANPYPVGAAQI